MTLMKSLFNKNVFLESLKQSKYVIILHTMAIFIITTLSAYMIRWDYRVEWLSAIEHPRVAEAIKNTLMGNNAATLWIMIFAAIVTVVVNFSYLFKTNSMQFYNSMPYKRSCMYISKAASCFVGLLAPVVIILLVNVFIYYGNMGLYDKAPLTELLNIALNVIVCYAVTLSIALFGVSVAGNIFALVFASGFAALWHLVSIIAVVMCCYVWFENFEITPDDNLVFMFPPIMFLEPIEMSEGWQNMFWAFSVIHIIVFPLMGLWCYNRRKSENTNKFLVFGKLASFFKYYVSVIGALGFGCIFADFDIPVLLVLLSYGVVFVLLYCILQALFAKNMQSLFKNMKKPLIIAAGFMIILAPFVSDLWEPGMISPAFIKSLEIENQDICITISDRENIKKTLEYLETNGEGHRWAGYEAELKIPFFRIDGNRGNLSDEKYEEYMDSILSSQEYIDRMAKKIEESPNYEIYTPTGSLDYYDAEEIESIRKDIEILIEDMRRYDYNTKKDSGVWGRLDNKEGDLQVRIYNCYEGFIEKIEARQRERRELLTGIQEFKINPVIKVDVRTKCCYIPDEFANICQVYSTEDKDIIEKFESMSTKSYWFEITQPVYITLWRGYSKEELEQLSTHSSWMPYGEYTVNYYDLPKEIREIINPEGYSYQTLGTNGILHMH